MVFLRCGDQGVCSPSNIARVVGGKRTVQSRAGSRPQCPTPAYRQLAGQTGLPRGLSIARRVGGAADCFASCRLAQARVALSAARCFVSRSFDSRPASGCRPVRQQESAPSGRALPVPKVPQRSTLHGATAPGSHGHARRRLHPGRAFESKVRACSEVQRRSGFRFRGRTRVRLSVFAQIRVRLDRR